MSRRTKIAVLGGGPAGLAAAFELTQAGPDAFDITVYEMGWRPGGKGTSGYRHWTPPGHEEPIWNRIEEHGLHILFGFYENFFSVMRQCYAELGRPADHPLASVEKAFEPRDFGTAMFRHRSRWKRGHVWFRRAPSAPGLGDPVEPGDAVERLAAFLANSFRNAIRPPGDPNEAASLLHRPFDAVGDVLLAVLTRLLRLAAAHPRSATRVLRFAQRRLRGPARALLGLFARTYLLWLGIDYFVALLIGLLGADILRDKPIETLDDRDFREWLLECGLHPDTAASPFVGMIYHAAFSYECGEPDRPRIAAGSALRVILSAGIGRRGSAYYRMRGGMGEVVFVPLFRTLEHRGVKFEFFHRVEALRLGEDGRTVEAIEVRRQAQPVGGRYDPCIAVKGVEAFPSEPLWDRLEGGDRLRELGVRFDSYYESRLPTEPQPPLRRGEHFDRVILATPIATLPYVADELILGSKAWRDMVEHVKSVQTVSLQIWFRETHNQLGWDVPDPSDPHTLLSMYAMPLSTWVPMDQTLPRENWPAGMEPSAVSYFTGVQPGPERAPAPSAQPRFPEHQLHDARVLSEAFVRNLLAEDLLENLEDRKNPPFPRFEALHDPEGRHGSARFDAQLVRANCEPSERVTLALPGATRFRLKAGATGFENLVIAGDWIDNGIHVACMEGAFSGGLLAARALLESLGLPPDPYRMRVAWPRQ